MKMDYHWLYSPQIHAGQENDNTQFIDLQNRRTTPRRHRLQRDRERNPEVWIRLRWEKTILCVHVDGRAISLAKGVSL